MTLHTLVTLMSTLPVNGGTVPAGVASRLEAASHAVTALQVCPTAGVEPRRHQARGKVSGCQHSARDTMVFIAGAAIPQQYDNAVGSNAESAGLARRLRTRKYLCATESQVVVS
jgi:hypothetical protein